MLLKDVETGVWCICSPSDLCTEFDTGVGRHNPDWLMWKQVWGAPEGHQ